MAKSYVYVLRCADGSLYTGWTTDLVARLCAHNGLEKGGAKYTRSRRPVVLAYYEECEDNRVAMRREFAIKRLTRAQKDALIASATGSATIEGTDVPYSIFTEARAEPDVSE